MRSSVDVLLRLWRKAPSLALPLIATHVALLALWDLSRWPYVTLLLLALAFVFWSRAACQQTALSPITIMLVAGMLRALLLPLPPTLSDDLLRYVWDGRVISAGHNAYLLPPEADELATLRDARWERMPHRHVATVYPPLALASFAVASQLPAPMRSLKIILSAADLLACWLLIRLAVALGLGAGRTVAYAWNPLVTLEIAGMGHVDALVVLASVAAVWVLVAKPSRVAAAAAAGSAAVLAKIVPLVALPAWARQSRRPWLFLSVALGLTAAVALPVVLSVGGIPPGLMTYGISWEWNGPLYEPLWRGLEHADVSAQIKAGFDARKASGGNHDFWNRFYPFVYPQLIAKGLLGFLFLGAALVTLRDPHPVSGSGRIFGWLLLAGATLYPWYLLWVLPWAALCRHRAWLALSALIQLSYLPQLTQVPLFPWIFLAIWGPFFALLAGSRWSID